MFQYDCCWYVSAECLYMYRNYICRHGENMYNVIQCSFNWNIEIWKSENLKSENLKIWKSEIWKSENLMDWNLKFENLKLNYTKRKWKIEIQISKVIPVNTEKISGFLEEKIFFFSEVIFAINPLMLHFDIFSINTLLKTRKFGSLRRGR